MYECSAFKYMYINVPHIHSACRDQKRALDVQKLELQVVMNCHVGSRNQILVLCKINTCF